MTVTAVAGACRRTATPAPDPWHCGMHGRRTCLGGIVDAGHASPTTTARDARRGGRARARATAGLRFPLPGGRDEGA